MFFVRHKVLTILLVVFVLGGLLGDQGAKRYAESTIETSVRRDIEGVSAVDASISSFPFLGRLLVKGKVSHFELVLHQVVGHRIPVEELRLDVDGLELDRTSLFGDKDVEITGIDKVRLQARITREDVEAVLGPLTDLAFTLTDGATLTVADGQVQLASGVSFPLPGTELIPCDATAKVRHDDIVVECTSDHLPQVVVDAVGSLELRRG